MSAVLERVIYLDEVADLLAKRPTRDEILAFRPSAEVETRFAGLIAKQRADVHDMLRWLAPIQAIELRAEHFRRVQLHRNNRIYGFLLHICEFIHEHWLPDERGGGRHFRDFVRDGLPSLFEKFVFNFYRHELPEWRVSAPIFNWAYVAANEDAMALVPRMETDVCLDRPGRAIILDTKFYARALKAGAFGTAAKLPSANLYQLFTYLRQRATESGWEHAEGVLLYPRTTRDFAAEFTTHGHRIRAQTLDLARPWKHIHTALMQIVDDGDAQSGVRTGVRISEIAASPSSTSQVRESGF